MDETTAETKPKVEGADVPISIKVKDQQGGEVVFRVKRSTKFEKIKKAFCEKKALDMASVRFVFDGDRVDNMSTPADLDMEDNDCVDAMVEQVGGAPGC